MFNQVAAQRTTGVLLSKARQLLSEVEQIATNRLCCETIVRQTLLVPPIAGGEGDRRVFDPHANLDKVEPTADQCPALASGACEMRYRVR